MKEIFQYLSHISYHNNDMGTGEKTIVLHTNFDRVLILDDQADIHFSIHDVLNRYNLGITPQGDVFCLDGGGDTHIPLSAGEHWDDAFGEMSVKCIYDNRDEPTMYHSGLSSLRTALHLDASYGL